MIKIVDVEKVKKMYRVTFIHNLETIEHKFNEEVFIKYLLVNNKQLSNDEYQEIIQYSKFCNSYQVALKYIDFQPRSEKEVIDYMKKKEISCNLLYNIINRLKNEGYINDVDFSMNYIKYHSEFSLKGPNRLVMELEKKGVDSLIISKSIKNYSISQQRNNIQKLIKKEKPKNKPIFKIVNDLTNKIINKGYDSDLVQSMTKNLTVQYKDSINEEKLIEKDFLSLKHKYSNENNMYVRRKKIYENLARRGYSYELINNIIMKWEV